jgi:hypothetical protein
MLDQVELSPFGVGDALEGIYGLILRGDKNVGIGQIPIVESGYRFEWDL